ncbi:HNH endonuclease [Microbacterium sp.]|uniref:HNH endonuclease n=1 Tax=Microbacterium sp. TaxID=51671 RepID=UPI003C792D43
MSLEELETGVGAASVDGLDTPLPAAAVRRLAADTQVIPCVLGGDSDILDWGRTRLYTPAQKLALAERDGGCAMCGAPPAWTHGHHIRWWNRDAGPTDLDNGCLLCTGCHHRIHNDGWDIRVEGTGITANVWFIPPPWIDPARTPRPGRTHRYVLSA